MHKELSYRGKNFVIPTLSKKGFIIKPEENFVTPDIEEDSPIMHALNKTWDEKEFQIARRPISFGVIPLHEQQLFSRPGVAPRILDMPIKFPGSDFRVPEEFAQDVPVIQRIANIERAINPEHYDEYYCYMTSDEGWVEVGELQREAPCHVDGFQGERWKPKVRNNHTYTLGDVIPTVYYEQPFETDHLDPAKHDYFWEFNRQVKETQSKHAWRSQPFELTMMDCYSVHRGDRANARVYRRWTRYSFEVRIFDRLGNAHNPLFAYNWDMVPRDIEALNLVAYDQSSDPSLRVFPWQDLDGRPLADPSKKTQPNLT